MRFIKTILPYLVIALISYIYLSQYSHYLFAINNEEVMAGAWRIVQGQVIYRDFFEIFAPGNFFLLALIYKIFGHSLIVTNNALIVMDVIINVLLYHISRIVIKRWYAVIPPLLFLIIGFPSWFVFSHYWTTSVTLFTAIILLSIYMEKLTATYKSMNIYLFLAGLFVGLTGIFLQSSGVYTAVVLSIVLYFKTKKHEGIIKHIVIFGTGIAIPVLVFILYLLLNNAFIPFIHAQIILIETYPAIVLFLMKQFMSLYNIIAPVKLIFLISFIVSLILLIFKKNTSGTEAVFFAGNIICFLDAWHRFTVNPVDTAYTTASLSFIFVGYMVVLSTKYIKNHYPKSVYKSTNLLIHGILIVITAIVVIIIYKDISNMKTKAVHFILNDTTYWTSDEWGTKNINKFTKGAEKILDNDKKVFIYPNVSVLYTLLDLRNPTRYDILFSFGKAASTPPDVMNDAIAELTNTNTKFIITWLWSYRFLSFWSQRNNIVFEPTVFDKFIWGNYKDALRVGLYTLWELKTLKPGDKIEITIKGHPMLSEKTKIDNKGNIVLPYVGKLRAAGNTIFDLRNQLAHLLVKYNIPSVDINVTGIALITSKIISISVLGAVKNPDVYNTVKMIRLEDAIALAGGPLTTSNLSQILIMRDNKTIKVNFINYLQTHNPANNPLLFNKDIVYVQKG